MRNPNLRVVPVAQSVRSKGNYQGKNRSSNKMLLGTYGYKVNDANGCPQWKIVNIPDEIY